MPKAICPSARKSRPTDYDFESEFEFIKVVESEALTLHAMMMTSMPYFILMKPNITNH
jgi:mevalonate pyrophosphate decarboxylase